MRNVNIRKRAAYARRVRLALQHILNDSVIMPNADFRDLIVSVIDVQFGGTVREIYVDFYGEWKESPRWSDKKQGHLHYMADAIERGDETYADLTDVAYFQALMWHVALALQERLKLRYTPNIRSFTAGCAPGGGWKRCPKP
jgi:hypothetical protein